MAAMFLFFIIGCASIVWAFTKMAVRTTKHVAVGTVIKAAPKAKKAAVFTGHVAVGTTIKAAPKVKAAAKTTGYVAAGTAIKAAPHVKKAAAPVVNKGKGQVSAFKAAMEAFKAAQ